MLGAENGRTDGIVGGVVEGGNGVCSVHPLRESLGARKGAKAG